MPRLRLVLGAVLALPVLAGSSVAVRADLPDPTAVYIECAEPGGRVRPGTGVLVSPSGSVLTAKHVVFGDADSLPAGTRCTGSLGDANLARVTLNFQSASRDYDAVMLKYPGLSGADHEIYCPVEPRHKRAPVLAAGFPRVSATGQLSERLGILATVEPDSKGLMESDVATTSGMSGGRVTFTENGGLVGIVAGVSTEDESGLPIAYAILAAFRLAPEFGQFGLSTDPALCARRRVTSPPPPPDGPWVPADGDLKLGMKADEGFCYLVRVWGNLGDPADSVAIEVDEEEEYVLTGTAADARDHGAEAHCVRF